MAAGMLSTLRYLGGVAGIAVLGAASAGYEGDPTALLRRATTAFAVSLGLAVLAATALPSGLRRGEGFQ